MPPRAAAPQRSESAPPARAAYHHGDLRRAMIDASVELVSEAGPQGLTLREVARRVGVNHRAAYRHFSSKEDLLAAVAEQGWWGLVDAMREALSGAPENKPEARMMAMGVCYVRFALGHAGHYQVMFGPRLNEEGRFPGLEVPIRAAVSLLEVELSRALPGTGAKPDARAVRDAGLALWAAMHGLATLLQQRRIRVKPSLLEAYVGQLLAPTVRGIVG